MRIGIAQIACPVDVDARLARRDAALSAIDHATQHGADLVILPEMAASGYLLDPEQVAQAAEPADGGGPMLAAWTAAARRSGAAVIGGFAEDLGAGRFANSVAVIDRDGSIVAIYRKLHLFGREHDVFEAGDTGLPIVEVAGARVGLLVCYDLRFPEVARILAVRGAQLIAVPTAWVAGFDAQTPPSGSIGQVEGVVVQANLNQVFIACADQVGSAGPITFLGRSVVVDPHGRTLLGPLSPTDATVETIDIDLAAVERAQHRGPGIDPRANRRTDVYDDLLGYRAPAGTRPASAAPATPVPPQPSATVTAPAGMVCSVDQLASAAGVTALRRGGSAADAAIAASAVLAVTAPHMCGMGGDLFAVVHAGPGPPAVLNASGRAGSGADPDRLLAEGQQVMPFRGDLRSAPVPGCVDGWLALHERFGRLPLAEVLAFALDYARHGFPVSPLLASASRLLGGIDAAPLANLQPGTRLRRPGVAQALEAIIEDGRDAFYLGPFGRGLLDLGGGEYRVDDLTRPNRDWVDPLGLEVWGHHVWTVPPNSQGYLTLLGAAIAEGLDLPDDPADDAWPHLLVESARQAGSDRLARLAEHADGRRLLAREEVARRRSLISRERRARVATRVASGDTIALVAVDEARMGVSLIQSNAADFGSHVFEPVTGIGIHNRGIGFSLEPGHPARYGPGRRPPSTLSPAVVTRPDGSLHAVLGTQGGDSQPQILLQLLARTLRHGALPGAAIAASRWVLSAKDGHGFETWVEPDGQIVCVEDHAPASWTDGLERRGHATRRVGWRQVNYGHAHLVAVRGDMLYGAADPRAHTGAAQGY
jgi:gamma-glutamyltranspeptidase / glutathione hydrolase